MSDKKRSPEEQWAALEEQALRDEMDRIAALSPEELDAEIRADGGDPVAIGQRGAALAKELLDKRAARPAWQAEAEAKLGAVRARFEARPKPRARLPRPELIARIELARRDVRLAQPVAVLFRNRSAEEASDDELAAILEEIEALAEHEE